MKTMQVCQHCKCRVYLFAIKGNTGIWKHSPGTKEESCGKELTDADITSLVG